MIVKNDWLIDKLLCVILYSTRDSNQHEIRDQKVQEILASSSSQSSYRSCESSLSESNPAAIFSIVIFSKKPKNLKRPLYNKMKQIEVILRTCAMNVSKNIEVRHHGLSTHYRPGHPARFRLSSSNQCGFQL